MFHKRQIRRVWHLVISATLWSIWLARNEVIFRNVRIKKSDLEELIFRRVSLWGSSLDFFKCGHMPLWRVNPQGALALYFHKATTKYWDFLGCSFEFICEVHGIYSPYQVGKGSIGGAVKDTAGRIQYIFSGPVVTHVQLEVEIIAILHLVLWIVSNHGHSKRSVICSDSIRAVNAVNHGVHVEFPHLSLPEGAQRCIHSNIFIQFVPEELNSSAISLASSGLHRTAMSENWHPQGPAIYNKSTVATAKVL